MKNSILFILVLFAVSCNSIKKSVNDIPATTTSQSSQPITQQFTGLGPVNIAASNFLYKGELKEVNGKLNLLDCFTGRLIPINNKSGIYSDLFSKFQTSYSQPVYVVIRGFINQNKKSQTTLTATYLNNSYEGQCNDSDLITGNWISDSMSTSPEGISLTINDYFSFT